MSIGTPATDLADRLVAEIERRLIDHHGVFVVAIDGRSGSGKSTLAQVVAARRPGWVTIDGDSFYAGGDGAFWDALDAESRVAHCIDWRRQAAVIESLRRGETAEWHGYDWEAFDGSVEAAPLSCRPATVVMLDGVYSARPELGALIDLRVLVLIDHVRRRAQLRAREGDDYRQEWEQRWSDAEDFYFDQVVAPTAFDLVLGESDAVS